MIVGLVGVFGLLLVGWDWNGHVAGVNQVKFEILRYMLEYPPEESRNDAYWVQGQRTILMSAHDQKTYIKSLLHDVRCIKRDRLEQMITTKRLLTVYGDMGIATEIWRSMITESRTTRTLPVRYIGNTVCMNPRLFTQLVHEQIERVYNWQVGFIGPVIAAVTNEQI